MFCPSLIVRLSTFTPLADGSFLQVLWRLLTSLLYHSMIAKTSLGKGFSLLVYDRYIYILELDLAFGLLCNLNRSSMPQYVISVRQTRTLPQASFRFLLTQDTLAID